MSNCKCNCCNLQPTPQPTLKIDLDKFIEAYTPHVCCNRIIEEKYCNTSLTEVLTLDIEDEAITWQKLSQEVKELILLRLLKYNGDFDSGITISIDGAKYKASVIDGVLELTSYE